MAIAAQNAKNKLSKAKCRAPTKEVSELTNWNWTFHWHGRSGWTLAELLTQLQTDQECGTLQQSDVALMFIQFNGAATCYPEPPEFTGEPAGMQGIFEEICEVLSINCPRVCLVLGCDARTWHYPQVEAYEKFVSKYRQIAYNRKLPSITGSDYWQNFPRVSDDPYHITADGEFGTVVYERVASMIWEIIQACFAVKPVYQIQRAMNKHVSDLTGEPHEGKVTSPTRNLGESLPLEKGGYTSTQGTRTLQGRRLPNANP